MLEGVNLSVFEYVDLSSNRLEGRVPSSLKLIRNSMFLEDNHLTEIDQTLCDSGLGGDIAEFGCAAILCPIGTFNDAGRQIETDFPCMPCKESKFLGATQCGAPPSGPEQMPSVDFPSDEEIDERSILMMLYSLTNGKNWHRNDNWGDSSVHYCDFFGVTCDER